MSSSEKGMEESSSSRKLWLAALLLSTISCFMRPSTYIYTIITKVSLLAARRPLQHS